MFEFDKGSAHGLAGILQTIMCFPDYLDLNQEAEKVVKESVDFLLSIQKPNGIKNDFSETIIN